MADIKTRDTVKGTIKTLNKAAIAGQKMKQAYIATKDKAEYSVNINENTAEEYAADKTKHPNLCQCRFLLHTKWQRNLHK